MNDLNFLKETLKLAKKGIGWVNPNPMVGAIIVKNGTIIGKGYHKKAGAPHAEIEALNAVTADPKGATIYVNLEPCSHYGKTPPCVDAIIKAKITKVVCCTNDPNPLVKGKGLKKLEEQGILISAGMLQKEARELNEIFFTFHEKKRPFIALKFAASLDGKIATAAGDSKWITNEKSRKFARILRSQYQSILVGSNTIIKDNPHLGTRMNGKKEPVRIILDSRLRIPFDSLVLRDNNVIIATTTNAAIAKKNILKEKGIEILEFDKKILLPELLHELAKREITSCFVEGGSRILGSFVDAKLADRVYAFHAPMIIGGEKAIPAVGGNGADIIADSIQLNRVSFKRLGDNLLTMGLVEL